ncbi:uncharacterized protein LOC112088422 [Eutrema salsugineum]|uniref:uncharacterized protein LOC112088422 n=1 Tax=Eutrema salsugineum TaxID=72664 RepID=UPI000CED28D5|nr:uncharacterized protein LOC112088422 [Eutrema salsugineum]
MDIRISKRCRVPFSIGLNYKDLVCCDVVPMDACHLLLGHPWHFDRRTIHDRFKNTHSFTYEGRCITLLPSQTATEPLVQSKELESPPVSVDTPKPALLISKAELLDECRATDVVFLLCLKPQLLSVISEAPSSFHALLTEFQDVFSTELPDGLPPLRNIQHCIDLPPDSVLPNRPHYRMSPREHDELQKPVEDLLAKGYIRESSALVLFWRC